MKKTLELLKNNFDSSSYETIQFKTFARTFKREFTKALKEIGATDIEISKGHFEQYGFFTLNKQVWYFSIGDVRWDKGHMLIRTAKDYKDFTGGANNDIALNDNFIITLNNFLKREC